ncbi:hypothetical protein IID19_04980 [Patescibacteria group bacterium]|nr:hypothetical protein [Patescibacteria group bacterium]
MFEISIDVSPFEQVCYLIYRRVKKLHRVPFLILCEAIGDLAAEHSMDRDTYYSFCLPDQVAFGGLAYPHEFFLKPESYLDSTKPPQPRMLKPSFWRSIIRKYRGEVITDKAVISFASEISAKLGLAA